MAKNAGAIEQYAPIQLALDIGGEYAAGDVALVGGGMVVYCQTDTENDIATVTIPCAFVEVVSVIAEDHAGAAAIEVGNWLYLDGNDINLDATDGVPFGYALDPVAEGATANIRVGFGL